MSDSDRVNDVHEEERGIEDGKFDDNQDSTEAETQQAKAVPKGEAKSPQAQPQAAPATDSKFFAIRTTGGQERVVASQIQVRVNSKKIGIRSVMVLDSFKGYIIVDRKSTRLNSSHGYISYAVFCLKKKT